MVFVNKIRSQNNSISSAIPSLTLGIAAFILWVFTNLNSSFKDNPVSLFIAPPKNINRLTFGLKDVITDSLWIRAIQGLDSCDKSIGKNLCQNESWLYKMIDAITELSPEFRIPYAAGSLALTILISDIDGATKIFEKAAKAFPKDWPMLYRAAYHYLYEVKDKKRAAELLVQAGKSGAPNWVFSLAGRLYSDDGELQLAENLLAEMKATDQDERIIKRLEEKIESVKKKKK